jgi:hypothetical protein
MRTSKGSAMVSLTYVVSVDMVMESQAVVAVEAKG